MPLADITLPGKLAYTQRHGYGFEHITHLEGRDIAWDRPVRWLQELSKLKENEWLFWTGCDAFVTNPSIKLESRIDNGKDFICSADYNILQSDSWLLRNCSRTRRWLGRVIAWEGMANDEQEAMNIELSRHVSMKDFLTAVGKPPCEGKLQRELNGQDVRVKLIPQEKINAYPMEFYPHGMQNDGTVWKPGCFIAHLPCKTLEFRIEATKKILLDSESFLGDKKA